MRSWSYDKKSFTTSSGSRARTCSRQRAQDLLDLNASMADIMYESEHSDDSSAENDVLESAGRNTKEDVMIMMTSSFSQTRPVMDSPTAFVAAQEKMKKGLSLQHVEIIAMVSTGGFEPPPRSRQFCFDIENYANRFHDKYGWFVISI